MKIYLIGSLRQDRVRQVADAVREVGHEVFDDWHACGPDADDHWRTYEIERGRSFREALTAPFARHCFEFDRKHIDCADACVLVMPAGKSGHLELGYAKGQRKIGYVLLDGEPERWDMMYQFADDVFYTVEELVGALDEF